MAAEYTCDICKHPIDDDDEVGRLSVRGAHPSVNTRSNRFSSSLDLCAKCAMGAYEALEQLAHPTMH